MCQQKVLSRGKFFAVLSDTVTSSGCATTVAKICRTLLCQPYPGEHQEQATVLYTAQKLSKGKKILLAILLEKSPHCVAPGGGNCIRTVHPSLLNSAAEILFHRYQLNINHLC